MSISSYAHNFEDVMLWRALKHVERGFYVDVGANDPDNLSVTKAFYDRGWRGINIEPTEQYYRKLLAKRPEDITIKVAVGDRPGTQTLYEIRDTGLTTVDPTIAKQLQANGWNAEEGQAVVLTLTEILAPYRDRDIHFLKIDIEGGEEQALRGMDFSQVRPWVLVIESVLPLTKNPSHEAWEPLVLQAGYKCVYFDGVNRFYVANEHIGLADAFRVPPRYFDDFILASEYDLEIALNSTRQELSIAKTARAQAESELVRAREDLQSKEYERQHLQERLEAVLTSHSWHMTAEALLAQTPVQADIGALIDAIRHRIVEALDSYVRRESRPVSALELKLLGHGLRVNSTVYPVDGLRRLPDPDVLEALSILLFKCPLEKVPTLRIVGRLVHRRNLILLVISVLPGRRAKISGLYRRVIRNMLSGSPLLLGFARRIFSKVG